MACNPYNMMGNRIAYIYKRERKQFLGSGSLHPDEFFYGYNGLSPDLEKTVYAEKDLIPPGALLPRGRWAGRIQDWLMTRRGFNTRYVDICAQSRTYEALNKEGLVFATTNFLALLTGVLYQKRLLNKKPVLLSMGLIPNESTPGSIVSFTRKVCRGLTLLTLSRPESVFLERILNTRVEYIPFGVDVSFWKPGSEKPSEDFILSLGNDRARDYETLIQSWRPDYPLLKIITKRQVQAGGSRNIEILKGDIIDQAYTHEELRSLYRRAMAVVVPITETIQPSGQSVTLQAMACGTPVILGKNEGLWDPAVMIDEKNIMLYEPGNVKSLRKKIEALLESEKLRSSLSKVGWDSVQEHYTSEKMASWFSDFFRSHLS